MSNRSSTSKKRSNPTKIKTGRGGKVNKSSGNSNPPKLIQQQKNAMKTNSISNYNGETPIPKNNKKNKTNNKPNFKTNNKKNKTNINTAIPFTLNIINGSDSDDDSSETPIINKNDEIQIDDSIQKDVSNQNENNEENKTDTDEINMVQNEPTQNEPTQKDQNIQQNINNQNANDTNKNELLLQIQTLQQQNKELNAKNNTLASENETLLHANDNTNNKEIKESKKEDETKTETTTNTNESDDNITNYTKLYNFINDKKNKNRIIIRKFEDSTVIGISGNDLVTVMDVKELVLASMGVENKYLDGQWVIQNDKKGLDLYFSAFVLNGTEPMKNKNNKYIVIENPSLEEALNEHIDKIKYDKDWKLGASHHEEQVVTQAFDLNNVIDKRPLLGNYLCVNEFGNQAASRIMYCKAKIRIDMNNVNKDIIILNHLRRAFTLITVFGQGIGNIKVTVKDKDVVKDTRVIKEGKYRIRSSTFMFYRKINNWIHDFNNNNDKNNDSDNSLLRDINGN